MKTRHFLLATLLIMAFTSCSAELISPAEDMPAKSVLETEYNALKISSVDAQTASLPAISMTEAENILKSLRSHKNAKEEFQVSTHNEGDAHLWDLLMKQTIDNKYIFTIQLHLTSYDDGSLFYNGYDTECSSKIIAWKVGGFSFESDKTDSDVFKFKSASNLFFKIASDSGEPAYYKVNVSIQGNYHSDTQTSNYTYTL